ncbi:glycoside hydrolase family 2 TIM barrel-domain containing protein [Cesiribacter sp. SM1]|uniref:glycoside hydrolase family 2 TIM barrel-domain containing protein n=1 Tax=Cesiribacter sp. SM1 TaxID=2861196 RepID=UPI001CD72621|nr:glycoside hydrolase family 2 TIM barrel-domain containing protein [Cesiribacter sp. SM1]
MNSCDEQPDPEEKYVARGRKVEIVFEKGNYTLLRNGSPYFIRGGGGYDNFDKIKEHGGNSVRVWHTDDAQRILDEAHKHGLTVTLGLWMAPEKDGFNYYDKELVTQQFEELRKVVLQYKDHPALLMWGLGNELNLEASNTKVWDAVNDIAEMIDELDPDHPTATMLVGARTKLINLIAKKCPAIDVIAVNTFGAMANIPGKIRESSWAGPYIVSEFGPRGYWESYTTWWYAPLEQTSSEKAGFIKERYQRVVSVDTTRCLGGYVFYWGYKFEGTPTWFSLFTKSGEETEMVHAMHELWTGDTTKNKPPYIAYLKLNKTFGYENIYLKPQQEYEAAVYTFDPEGDSLRIEWELLPEVFDEHGNEGSPTDAKPLPLSLNNVADGKIRLRAPAKEGPYRLFVYVYDGQGNVGTANTPFYVNSAGMYTKRD